MAKRDHYQGLLLLVGNGGVVFAEQAVASGLAAFMIATTPLFLVLFAGILGAKKRTQSN